MGERDPSTDPSAPSPNRRSRSFDPFNFETSGRTDVIPDSDSNWLLDIVRAQDISTVKRVIRAIMGDDFFEAGIVFGLVESFAESLRALLELIKMVAFACAYEYFFAGPLHSGLLSGPIARALNIHKRTGPIYDKLWNAREDLIAIREELKKLLRKPEKYLATATESFAKHVLEQLQEVTTTLQRGNRSQRFDAGEKLGKVIGDVLQLLIAVRAAAEVITGLPRLAKLASKFEKEGGSALKKQAARRIESGGKAQVEAPQAAARSASPPAASKPAQHTMDTKTAGTQGQGDANRVCCSKCTTVSDPVDVATGKVFTVLQDLELPGPLGLRWERAWYSSSSYRGPLGHGWHHSYDAAIHVDAEILQYRTPDGRARLYPRLQRAGETYLDLQERWTLLRTARGYALREHDGRVQRFETEGARPGSLVLSGIEVPSGHRMRFAYNAKRQLSEIVDGGGRSIELEYDVDGRITTVRGPHAELPAKLIWLRYEFDGEGNLSAVIDAEGHATRYRYQHHLMVQATDRNGVSFNWRYAGHDTRARCIRTWGNKKRFVYKFRYEDDKQVTAVEDSSGSKTQYEHRRGLVTRTVDPLGATTTTTYDEFDRKLFETDALGRVTRYEYDARSNPTAVIRPDGSRQSIRYDDQNRVVAVLEGNATRWRYDYDLQGRLTARTNGIGERTEFVYHGRDLAEVVRPTGARFETTHDEQGNLVAVRDPLGATRRYAYDALGRLTKETDAAGNERQYSYDVRNRVVRVVEPSGNVRELSYDREDNLVRSKDARRDVQLEYEGVGCLASITEAGTSVHFEYDLEQRLRSVRNEQGEAYRFLRDARGDIVREQRFGGRRYSYTRNLAGEVSAVQRPDGSSSQYGYDECGRLQEVKHSDGEREIYAYSREGALLSASNAACTLRFERDAAQRVVKTWQDQHWIESELDADGRRTRMASSLGADLPIGRDPVGDVNAIDMGRFSARMQRDVMGLEIERQLPGGVRSHIRRDRLGRPIEHEVVGADGTLAACSYVWDVDGRLLQENDASFGPTSYAYDKRRHLAWAQFHDGSRELRIPDAVSNLFRTEDRSDRVYGFGGELLEALDEAGGKTHYKYDAAGQLIEKRDEQGRTWRYAWNAAGTLREVTRPDGNPVRFAYDPFGRRIAKQYRGQTTHTVWDHDVPLHEWVEGQVTPLMATVPERQDAALEHWLQQGAEVRGSQERPITWLFHPERQSALLGDRRCVRTTCQPHKQTTSSVYPTPTGILISVVLGTKTRNSFAAKT
jgi:YD repeat-containing protein